jgi:hypothetical protein
MKQCSDKLLGFPAQQPTIAFAERTPFESDSVDASPEHLAFGSVAVGNEEHFCGSERIADLKGFSYLATDLAYEIGGQHLNAP